MIISFHQILFKMISLQRDLSQVVSMIHQYQKHIILGRQFIRELEAAGGDPNYLIHDVAEMENKIKELQKKYQSSFQ
jgi:hypothetical protein